MKVLRCDVCGRVSETPDAPGWGNYVTTSGVKDACGPDCMMKGLDGKDVCTYGTLNLIERQERIADEHLGLRPLPDKAH